MSKYRKDFGWYYGVLRSFERVFQPIERFQYTPGRRQERERESEKEK